MIIKFKKLEPLAIIPTRKHPNDSGMDICSTETKILSYMERHTFSTGIAAEIPEGYELQVRPRSSLSSKNGVVAILGTVDQCYKGEIRVILLNTSNVPYTVNVGERIAQLVLAPVSLAEIEETDTLSNSDRGIDGFGSTGK